MTVVRYKLKGLPYPITLAWFGAYARQDAERRMAELEADEKVIRVEVVR